jgi:hypothetical protein
MKADIKLEIRVLRRIGVFPDCISRRSPLEQTSAGKSKEIRGEVAAA